MWCRMHDIVHYYDMLLKCALRLSLLLFRPRYFSIFCIFKDGHEYCTTSNFLYFTLTLEENRNFAGSKRGKHNSK